MTYDISGNPIGSGGVYVPLLPGQMDTTRGCSLSTYSTFWDARVTPLISIGGPATIKIDPSDDATVSSFKIFEYGMSGDVVTFVRCVQNLSFTNHAYTYTPGNSVKYIRIMLVLSASSTAQYSDLEIDGASAKICGNPNITDGSKIQFNYIVDGETYTAGQLLLPPNYSVDGKPCPLVVLLHGTSSMNTWTQEIGTNSGTSTRYLLDYLTNEGFAVFDCYCFTSKYYSASYQNQAAPLPIFMQAYAEGVKHACKNFNIDAGNVFAFSMSAGGHLAFSLIHGHEIPARAVAIQCPSSGFVGPVFRAYFLHQSMREIIVDYLGLSEETGASTFVSVEKGLDNATVRQFINDHLDSFAGLICIAIGANGATFEEQYEWMTTWTATLPQWMFDLSLPAIPSIYTTSPSTGIARVVEHPELSAFTPIPTKFWQAFDDTNVMAHVNYTAYTWLKNGGSHVYWRTMPNNTGGHHAVDTASNALKSSGTTRLGVSYSNIATAYVEMADFFYQNMSQ